MENKKYWEGEENNPKYFPLYIGLALVAVPFVLVHKVVKMLKRW